MTRWTVGPFGRVEGDLEVQLEVEQGVVCSARVVSSLYRGFEPMLRGKPPADALVYTPRICGICSVSQSVAAARALADAQGIAPPPNGLLATNLVLANENLVDHLTHFYLLFMPDFARGVYRNRPWHRPIAERFTAIRGSASAEAMSARARFLHLMGLLAGKWPHSLAIQPGGVTRSVSAGEKAKLAGILFEFRRFLEERLFGDQLEAVAGLESGEALRAWADARPWNSADLPRFLHLADDLALQRLGAGPGRFMSYGAYATESGRLFTEGVWDGGPQGLDVAGIREDLSHAWMTQGSAAKHPFEGITQPDADAPAGYTWCKAPRLDGRVMEVGALARQQVAGHPLIRDLVGQGGAHVAARVIARLLELALVVPQMEAWVRELRPGEVCCDSGPMPDEASGQGLTEAARGSLGHWVRIKNGRILNYQIVAPTTWNFSPRDGAGVPGALEQALVGAPVREGERDPVAVQHIVRSFDPCMVCTVH